MTSLLVLLQLLSCVDFFIKIVNFHHILSVLLSLSLFFPTDRISWLCVLPPTMTIMMLINRSQKYKQVQHFSIHLYESMMSIWTSQKEKPKVTVYKRNVYMFCSKVIGLLVKLCHLSTTVFCCCFLHWTLKCTMSKDYLRCMPQGRNSMSEVNTCIISDKSGEKVTSLILVWANL